jgi:hypothetical protein
MQGITITRKVSLSLTADQWQLYRLDGREAAARSLNIEVESAINSSADRWQADPLIRDALRRWSDFGAADTEGEDVADDILRAFFHG